MRNRYCASAEADPKLNSHPVEVQVDHREELVAAAARPGQAAQRAARRILKPAG